ncbi:MAG: energy-coupling factor transporter transmembrane protein EcfT [Spirochaetaceae bacterium]|jgi:energy-coupling factor transporter transmembrane protein EcfT|nr:energy-coupling factor transporter transmembrane protein EcfT [Spirochaetaceae bacterium]
MNGRETIFRYKRGRSVCHRLPAPVKFALMLCAALIVMFLPLAAVCSGIALMAVFACACGFTPKEQGADIRPALYYAAFLFMLNSAANLFALFASDATVARVPANIADIVVPNAEYILYAARLVLVMQLSALLFRTTTSIEIKKTLCAAEIRVRALIRKCPFAKNLSPDVRWGKSAALMISFIPALFELWERLNRAYRARSGGRNRGGPVGSLKKYRILLVALIALSFHHASQKAQALAAREASALREMDKRK